MSVLTFSLVVYAVSAVAGFLGSLTGLGSGVVIVPVLYTASGRGPSLCDGRIAGFGDRNLVGRGVRLRQRGFLQHTGGHVSRRSQPRWERSRGAHLTSVIPGGALAVIFGAVLLYSAWHSFRTLSDHLAGQPDRLAVRLKLDGSYPAGPAGKVRYHVQRVKAGFSLMFGAGLLSGLLGIGSGAMKVIAMDQIMQIPFKVSTTTSNFMIGVTAAASAGIYLRHGYIDPGLAMPVMLGVLTGSIVGARQLIGAGTRVLRWVFAGVVGVMAIEMIYNGFSGRIQ